MMDFNEEQLAFYSEVGRAITTWAHVEFALSWITAICFQREDTQLAVDTYLSIENIRAKLKFTDAALASRGLSKSEKAKWANLMKQTERHSTKRNRLAHSWVMNDLERKTGRRKMLLPTRPVKGQKYDKYPGAVCVKDVVGYRLEFLALMCALENFADRLLGQEAQFPKSQEQAQRPPTLHHIRQQIYAYASRPPQPSKA